MRRMFFLGLIGVAMTACKVGGDAHVLEDAAVQPDAHPAAQPDATLPCGAEGVGDFCLHEDAAVPDADTCEFCTDVDGGSADGGALPAGRCNDDVPCPSAQACHPGACVTLGTGEECLGYCVDIPASPVLCGGIAGVPCSDPYTACVDDPRDDCEPGEGGGADCGGICLPQGSAFCGGIGNIPCAEGFTCIDDPSDDCDPGEGGADCGGICVGTL